MSITNRYAKPQTPALDAQTLKQVQATGQKMAANGVAHDKAPAQTAPTPAQKFAKPDSNHVLKSQQVQGERTHALSPDSNMGQKPPARGRSL